MKSLAKKAENYDSLSDTEKVDFINDAYHNNNLSWSQVAQLCGKNANTMRREAHRLGVKSRSRSESQKIALETGAREHPTKGKKHSNDTKVRISEGVFNMWDNMTEEEREYRRQLGKDRWELMSDAEKEDFRKKAGDAVRKAAKEGSKLERNIFGELIKKGYNAKFHFSRLIAKDALQMDIWLPTLKVAIEIDGPSHFLPIWGEEVLQKNRKADSEKDGLLLAMGICVVRVQQRKSWSQKYQRVLINNLLETLEQIKKKFPEEGKRHFVIGEEDE